MNSLFYPVRMNSPEFKKQQSKLHFGDADFERRKRLPLNHQERYDSSGRIVQNLELADQFLRQEQPQLGLAFFDAFDRYGPQSDQTLSVKMKLELHKIKQANLDLAKDVNNAQAKSNLEQAIQYLKRHHYFNNALIAPQVIHGLANLGTYTLNNDVYKQTIAGYSPDELQENTEDFEGLFIDATHYSSQQRQTTVNNRSYAPTD